MLINNKEIATRIRLGYSLFFIIYLLFLVLSLIFTFTANYLFEIAWTIFFVFAFSIYFMKGFNFILFDVTVTQIVFRWQALNPFITNPKSIEINKKEFVKYQIEKSMFGLREQIVFFQKSQGNIAKYPPISISSLTKKEKNILIKSLA